MRTAIMVLALGLMISGCSQQAPDIRGSAVDEASRDIRSSETLSSGNQLLEGKLQYEKGQYNQAAKHLVRAIANDRQNWEALYYLGLTEQKLGQYDRAVDPLKSSLKYSPPDRQISARINYALGVSWEKTGYLPRAREQYVIAVSLWPELLEAKDALTRLDTSRAKAQTPQKSANEGAR